MKEIYLEENEYPHLLKQITNAPKKLYVQGNIKNLNKHCIAMVGSRNCTQYGEKWCKIFVEELIQYDVTIVSGMAVGIDTIAHEAALQAGGKTIAVLPCGFEQIYPKENKSLYQKIISSGGSVVTEYSLQEKANSNRFLERNRLVSGLSLAVLVVEAAYRSGTSVTAKLAKSQNRDVFCIPGNLEQTKSVGTNELIKQFAKIVTSPKDIILNYPFLHKTRKTSRTTENWRKEKIQNNQNKRIIDDFGDGNQEYREIYQVITEKPIHIDKIVKDSKKDLKKVISTLTILELEGKIIKTSGNRYIRK